MAFERIRKFADVVAGAFVPTTRTKPLEARRRELENMLAYVDPTRLFVGGKLSIPYNPSVLVTRKGLELFDQMKQDEQVKYALRFKKDTILAPGWEIVSPGDQKDDWEVTQFVREQFEMVEGGFNKALGKVMTAMEYGYSISEKVYGEVQFTPAYKPKPEKPEQPGAPGAKKPPFGKGQPPKKGAKPFAEEEEEDEISEERPEGARDGDVGLLKGKPQSRLGLKRINALKPHYFDFHCDEHGTLLSLLQKYVPGQKQIMEFAPAKFIIHSVGEEFENKYGRSELEACYRAWWVKNNAYKWMAVMLERYGMPPIFMLYNNSAYQGAQLEELKKVVKNIQNATMGMIPRAQETDLDFWTPELAAQASDVFLKSLTRFDQDIARALLVPSLIGVTPDEGAGKGSLARSTQHFDGFMNTILHEQDDIAVTVNEQLVRPLCDLNWPGLKTYPKFKFMPFKDTERFEAMKTWQALVEGKIVNRIEDDERHIRDVFEMPENDNPVIEELASDELNRAKAEATLNPPVDPNAALKAAAKPPLKKKSGANFAEGEVVEDDELTPQMKAFAEGHDGVWFHEGGRFVCHGFDSGFDEKPGREPDELDGGVWRTINGRRVFIRNGEKPTDAIKRSLIDAQIDRSKDGKGFGIGDPVIVVGGEFMGRHGKINGFEIDPKRQGLGAAGMGGKFPFAGARVKGLRVRIWDPNTTSEGSAFQTETIAEADIRHRKEP
jgi:hypothetical protein